MKLLYGCNVTVAAVLLMAAPARAEEGVLRIPGQPDRYYRRTSAGFCWIPVSPSAWHATPSGRPCGPYVELEMTTPGQVAEKIPLRFLDPGQPAGGMTPAQPPGGAPPVLTTPLPVPPESRLESPPTPEMIDQQVQLWTDQVERLRRELSLAQTKLSLWEGWGRVPRRPPEDHQLRACGGPAPRDTGRSR